MLLAFDLWGVLTPVLIVLGVLVALFVVQLVHFSSVLAWGDAKTRGLGYYGASLEEREKFKKTLRFHGVLLWPILRFLGRRKLKFEDATFVVDGVGGRRGPAARRASRRRSPTSRPSKTSSSRPR